MWKAVVLVLAIVALSNCQRFDGRPGSWKSTRPPHPPPDTEPPQPITSAPVVPDPPVQKSSVCDRKNARYPVAGQCDAYIECHNFVSREMLCPEGLHFDPEAPWKTYPCGYPSDVPCKQRTGLQPVHPTADCPHQYGYFRAGDALNCGAYRQCVAGISHDMMCPVGLAWNAEKSLCDWPDQVPECDVEGFIGFRCPAPALDENGEAVVRERFYRNPKSCTMYFACVNDKPRLLSCDPEFAFDEVSGRCQEADTVQCVRQ